MTETSVIGQSGTVLYVTGFGFCWDRGCDSSEIDKRNGNFWDW